MNEILPLVAIALTSRDRKRGNRLVQSAVPTLIPGPTVQRVAIATVLADQQARDDERELANAEEQIAQEAAAAADIIVQKQGARLTEAELAQLPQLDRVLKRRPDLRQKFVVTASTGLNPAGIVRVPADVMVTDVSTQPATSSSKADRRSNS